MAAREAIVSAENSGNPYGQSALIRDPLAVGDGVAAPSLIPHPRCWPLALRSCPNEKSWARPVAGVLVR